MTDRMSERLARDIEILAELFKTGGWSEVRVESEGLSLLLSTDHLTPPLDSARIAMAPEPTPAHASAPVPQPFEASTKAPAPVTSLAPPGEIDPAWFPVNAPNLGTFYRSPKPGAAPFVEVGDRVEANTELCLIEVMKLFTSVQAGTAGTVRHIAVADAELVEGGQALIYIERN